MKSLRVRFLTFPRVASFAQAYSFSCSFCRSLLHTERTRVHVLPSISFSPSAPPILEFTLERKFVIRAGFIVPVCEEMEEVAAAKSSFNMFTSTILGCSSPVPEMDPELMAPKVVK